MPGSGLGWTAATRDRQLGLGGVGGKAAGGNLEELRKHRKSKRHSN